MSKSHFQNGWSFLYIVYIHSNITWGIFSFPFPFKNHNPGCYISSKSFENLCLDAIYLDFVCLFVCLFVWRLSIPTSCAGIMEVGVQPFVGHFIDLLQIAGLDIVDKMSQVTLQQTKHIVTRGSSWQELPFTIIYRGAKRALSYISHKIMTPCHR